MQQESLSLLAFQKRFRTEKACQKHLFKLRCRLRVIGALAVDRDKAYFHRTRHLYACKACGYQTSVTAGTIFLSRTPLRKWFWMIFLMGRQKSGASMLSLHAAYKLAGLIELDDTYVGGPKPGKRGRGAAGKSKVLVAVENSGR